jgi:hypothetical protein
MTSRATWNLRPEEPKKENLPPGPKKRRRRAADGSLCPPGAEPTKYRAERPFLKRCRKGHDKPHPGRCVICRRASDKARDMGEKRAAQKAAAYWKWKAKEDAKAKIAAQAKRRNERQEQKAANARRAWERRHGIYRSGGNAKAVAAKLKALAEAKANQTGYGIERVAYQERR